MKTKIMTIFAIMVLAITPFTSVSADMWSETPDIFDSSRDSSIGNEPLTFNYSRPAVDMWAETPDLNDNSGDYDVVLEADVRFDKTINPELYAETPDMDRVFAAGNAKSDYCAVC